MPRSEQEPLKLLEIPNLDKIIRQLRRSRNRDDIAVSRWLEDLHRSGLYMHVPQARSEAPFTLSLAAIRAVVINGSKFGAMAAGFGPKASERLREIEGIIQLSPDFITREEISAIAGKVAGSGAKVVSALEIFETIGLDNTLAMLSFPKIFLNEASPSQSLVIAGNLLRGVPLSPRKRIVRLR